MSLHKGNCNTTVMSVGTLCHRIISYLHILAEAYNIGRDSCIAWSILLLFGHCSFSMLCSPLSFMFLISFWEISIQGTLCLVKSTKAIQHRYFKVSNCWFLQTITSRSK